MKLGTCVVSEVPLAEFENDLLDELSRFTVNNRISQRTLVDVGWRWLFSLKMSHNGQGERRFYDIVSRRYERSGNFWILKA